MSFSIQQLKQARDSVSAAYDLSTGDAARVIGYYNGAGPVLRPDYIEAILAGDLSGVPAALSALGLQKIPEKDKILIGSSKKNPPFDSDTKKSKKKTPAGGRAASVSASGSGSNILPFDNAEGLVSSNISTTKGDIIKDDLAEVAQDGSKLPEGFADTVRAWFDSWAEFEGVDLSKIHAQQWRAACMMIGQRIKAAHILDDTAKIKARGGRAYSGEKLEELLQVWAYFCGTFKQVPLVSDFVSFSGVSSAYFYDYTGRGLSSTSISILQKARAIEAGGLSSSVAGGGAGVIGGIFLLKARHGYSETVNVNHVSSTHDNTASALPVFGDNGLCIEDNTKNVDNSP